MRDREIVIYRHGNRILVRSTEPRILDLLRRLLTFTETIYLRGKEQVIARKAHLSPVRFVDHECFGVDFRGRIATNLGFLETIVAELEKAGRTVTVEDVCPHPDPSVYTPQFDAVFGNPDFEFRYKQKKVLRAIAAHEYGRIDCPTGYGKTFLIGVACLIYPRAKIDVISRAVSVLRDTIHPALVTMGVEAGIVGGGRKQPGRRVMCYTADSLHHARFDEADLVFYDEVYEAAADRTAENLGRYMRARMWGLAAGASQEMRNDGKDFRCLGLFGPSRIHVSYVEARDRKLVVPIVVLWSHVTADVDPCAGLSDTEKERAGVWANEARNAIIARDAHLYDDDVQVLIVVKTLEHALYLKRVLPEFSLVYNGGNVKGQDLAYYRRIGLIDDSFRVLSDRGREKRTRRFKAGKLKKVIVTTVWNAGVDMTHLQVLIRGDAGGSRVSDTQIPGRATRLGDEDSTKIVGLVHDYLDQFNSGFRAKAVRRWRSYADLGFDQKLPSKDRRSTLRKLMEWAD